MKKSALAALCAAMMLSSAALRSDDAPALKFDVKGFAKAWAQIGPDPADNGLHDAALSLKSSRLVIKGTASDSVSVQVVPELAAGIKLLDAFVAWKALPHYTLVMGQFKFPFGLDRMGTPASLERVDYSMTTGRVTSRVAVNGWDQGLMAKAVWGLFKLDAAVFQGQGPNVASGLQNLREYSATLEAQPIEGLRLGASLYSGQDLNPASPPDYASAAYAAWKWQAIDLDAEYLARHSGVYGVRVQPGYRFGEKYKALAYYDHVEDPREGYLSNGRTEMGAALLYDVAQGLRLTLQASGSSAGPDETPRSSSVVLQALAKF